MPATAAAAWTSGMAGSRFSRLLRGLPVWPDRGFHACCVDFRYGRIEVFTLAAWTSGMAGSRFSRLLRGLPVWPDRGFHACCVDFRYGRIEVFTLAAWTSGMAGSRFSRLVRGGASVFRLAQIGRMHYLCFGYTIYDAAEANRLCLNLFVHVCARLFLSLVCL